MTIEEVSVIFDTGRKGDAEAAALHFAHGKEGKELTPIETEVDDSERNPKAKNVSHIE